MTGIVEQLSEHKARRVDPLSAEVIDALKMLGGAAHLDALVIKIAARRRVEDRPVSDSLRERVLELLEQLRDPGDRADSGGGALFYRPFGGQSLRWALCRDAKLTSAPITGAFGTAS